MNYYNEIKKELINNEINRKIKKYSINRSDLNTYYNVGKMLSEAGKHYGEGIIKKYSQKLINEVDKKYNQTNLKRMRQFYFMIQKGALMGHQLSWSHYRELIPLKDTNKINYYINLCENNFITRDELKYRIKSNEYERLPIETRNKLISKEESNIIDYIKNPILIKDNNNEIITELKKEHIGQIQIYMNYIDKNLRKINQDKTIGIIICKQDNKFVIKYCSDSRIIARTYELV